MNICKKHPLEKFHFCPECGSPHFEVNDFKSKKCTDCGFVYYFNPSAACVAIIMTKENELLVARRKNEPAKDTLDLPGGFVDMGETGEEAIAREVKEETGLTVSFVAPAFTLPNTYLYSGFLVHTLDIFYICRVSDWRGIHADDDVADLYLIPLAELEPEDFGLDSIRKGIKMIKEQLSRRRR